jgi:hypothetical protein
MAVLNSNVLTIYDWAKRIDPKGKIQRVVELLAQKNQMIQDALFVEGDLPNGNRTTVRTGLPDVYWRLANQGIPPSKSRTAQITDQAGCLEGFAETDVKVANQNGQAGRFRMDEVTAFMEALSQESSATMVYGTAANPEEFIGLAPRYSDLSAENGENILDAGGTGSDNTSVWLTGWGKRKVFGFFPMGSKAGIKHRDLGIQVAETTSGVGGERMLVYRDHFSWDIGLAVADHRYVVRVANIDVSDLEGITGTQALTASTSVIKMMSRAIDRLYSTNDCKPIYYANRTLLSLLRVVALEKSSAAVTVEPAINQFGRNIHEIRFLGIPVHLMDQISNAEQQVT